MKKIIKQLFVFSLLAILFTSCKKDENRITSQGGTDPVLTASQADSIPLSFINKDNQAVTFSWTNPNYMFTTGLSSQDVSYTLEIDSAGSDFKAANLKSVSIANDLSTSFTQDALNSVLLNDLVFPTGVPSYIEVRVKSTLANATVPLYSTPLTFKVTPYAIPPKVDPPATGHLYFVGNASPGGWNNPVPIPTQEFAQLSPTLYELTLPLIGGNSYLFLPLNGDWTHKYGGIGANNTNNPAGDDFRPEGGDLLAPAISGTYKIDVDFQRGKFTLTLQ